MSTIRVGGAARLVREFHSIQVDVVDAAGRVTSVKVMGSTGELNPKCGPRVGDRIVPDEECARNYLVYEVWYFAIRVGSGTIDGARFFSAPGTAVYNPMTYMKIGDLAGFTLCQSSLKTCRWALSAETKHVFRLGDRCDVRGSVDCYA